MNHSNQSTSITLRDIDINLIEARTLLEKSLICKCTLPRTLKDYILVSNIAFSETQNTDDVVETPYDAENSSEANFKSTPKIRYKAKVQCKYCKCLIEVDTNEEGKQLLSTLPKHLQYHIQDTRQELYEELLNRRDELLEECSDYYEHRHSYEAIGLEDLNLQENDEEDNFLDEDTWKETYENSDYFDDNTGFHYEE